MKSYVPSAPWGWLMALILKRNMVKSTFLSLWMPYRIKSYQNSGHEHTHAAPTFAEDGFDLPLIARLNELHDNRKDTATLLDYREMVAANPEKYLPCITISVISRPGIGKDLPEKLLYKEGYLEFLIKCYLQFYQFFRPYQYHPITYSLLKLLSNSLTKSRTIDPIWFIVKTNPTSTL